MTTEGFDQATDNSTGRTYYWSICGYDDNEAFEQMCGEDNAVCYSNGGEMSTQAFFPAGSFDSLTAEAIDSNNTIFLLLTYDNGVYCEAGQKNSETSFALVCDENATSPVVDNFTYSADGCDVVLTIRTSAACVRDSLPSGCAQWWNRRRLFHIAFWALVSIFSVCCCCACCAAIRRRRCRRACKSNYTELQETQVRPAPAVPQPVVPQQVAQPQIVQINGQYFVTMNGVQYPVQMVPAPQYAQYMQAMQQEQNFQPEQVPLVPLDEEVVDLQSSQIDEDEKFARQLQAQLNQ